jgi:hypothetical protein
MSTPGTLLVALAFLVLLAGCGSTSHRPPSGPRAVALPAAFQGEWSGHGRGLAVKADGTGVMTYRTYQWCTDVVTTACDKIVNEGIVDGGHDEMVFTSVSNSVATGTIQKSTYPKLVGSSVTFAVHPDGTSELHQAKQPNLTWTFCGPNAVNEQNYCGA